MFGNSMLLTSYYAASLVVIWVSSLRKKMVWNAETVMLYSYVCIHVKCETASLPDS